MLQGSIQSLICAYVFNELPRIYKHVRLTKPKPLEDKQKKKQSTPGKALVKCDQCRFKSTMVQMKMHIKNIHSKKPTRASKRLPVCTPGSKPPKRTKPESKSRAKVATIELIDDSILLIPDDPPVFDASNLEEMVTDSAETVSDTLPMKDMEVTGLVSCNLCDFDSESNDDLKVHMSIGLHTTENHAAFVCQLCHFAFKDKSVY